MREMRVRLSEEGDGNEIAPFSGKRMMKVRMYVPREPLAGSRSAVSEIFSDTALLFVFRRQDRKSLQWHQGNSCRRCVQRVERPVAGSESVRVTTMS